MRLCGIIGITGRDDAVDEIIAGLRRLEYRGYDSAGVVVNQDRELRIVKRAGKLGNLTDALDGTPIGGRVGIGHTRWATHGAPNDKNAHPHTDPDGRVAVVHNGIIENYGKLKATLGDRTYRSDTDTEVVAHLCAQELAAMDSPDLLEAVRRTVNQLEGAFALCFVAVDDPDTIVVAKREAPLLVTHKDGVGYCASDAAALIAHNNEMSALLDDQIAKVTPHGVQVIGLDGETAQPHTYEVDWDLSAAEKQGYEHFMLKEIHEQPDGVRDTLRDRLEDGRLHLDEVQLDPHEFAAIDKVFIVACGTSLHAGMVGKLAIEHWAGIPVEVEVASEFRYRDPILSPHTLVMAISQSGETADTLAAVAHARDQRAPVLSVCNVVGSTLARESDAVLYTHAGPEVAVASTKAFTTQIVGVLVVGLFLAQARNAMYPSECQDQLRRLQQLPDLIKQTLDLDPQIEQLAERYKDSHYTMFIGRHAGLPIAYEGALKLKEISYLHAEAFPAGEMKHGPIALIEEGSLVIAVATQNHLLGKMISNIQEVKARGASVLALGTEGATAELKEHADDLLILPEASHELAVPVLSVIPLQLFSYHVATKRGADVDQPRNLAKTVTVE